MRYNIVETAWGHFAYVAGDHGVVATFLPQPRRAAQDAAVGRFPGAAFAATLLPRFGREVAAYFVGRNTSFSIDLDLSQVTPFRRRVLEACRAIPFGKTASYADLARAAGNPAAVRAAGSAMANNPLPLVIPCHRVLCSDGRLGGFSSPCGVSDKLRLLGHERIPEPRDAAGLFQTKRAPSSKGRLAVAGR